MFLKMTSWFQTLPDRKHVNIMRSSYRDRFQKPSGALKILFDTDVARDETNDDGHDCDRKMKVISSSTDEAKCTYIY